MSSSPFLREAAVEWMSGVYIVALKFGKGRPGRSRVFADKSGAAL